MRYKNSKSKALSMRTAAPVVVILLIAAVLAVLEFTDVIHIFHKEPRPISGSSYTKGEVDNPSNGKQTSPANSSQPGSQKSNGGNSSDSTATLLAPSGDFVSNHSPSLSNKPTAPNLESSVCTSTPGASCKITFTKDGVTKSLAATTTDRGGSAYWDWKLQDIGLSAGTWKIQAVATLGGQSQTSNDARDLEVAP
jgi:hypothetical protein